MTEEQACAVAELSAKVIASAGSGKTAVIIAKALHLSQHLNVPDRQILALAFNRKAAAAIRSRLAAAGNHALSDTCHAFAGRVIGQAAGAAPDIAALSTDEQARTAFFQKQIKALATDPETGRHIIKLLAEYHSIWEFDSPAPTTSSSEPSSSCAPSKAS